MIQKLMMENVKHWKNNHKKIPAFWNVNNILLFSSLEFRLPDLCSMKPQFVLAYGHKSITIVVFIAYLNHSDIDNQCNVAGESD